MAGHLVTKNIDEIAALGDHHLPVTCDPWRSCYCRRVHNGLIRTASDQRINMGIDYKRNRHDPCRSGSHSVASSTMAYHDVFRVRVFFEDVL